MSVDIEPVIREYLPEIIHLSLATSSNNTPWVCEVHFAYDDDLNLYFRSLASRRHCQEIAENPRVAGNIVKQHGQGQPPLGVYFEGTAKMLDEGPEQTKAAECIQSRLNPPKDIIAEAKLDDGAKFYKISVENYYVFGKLGDEKMGKHQLAWPTV